MAKEEEKPRTPKTDSWDDFAGDYLKPDLIKEFPVKLPVINISSSFSEDKRPMLEIETEYNGKSWKLNLNKTNQNFLRANGIKSPKEIIGKVLVFDKMKVRNPSTNSMVDSFVIDKIE